MSETRVLLVPVGLDLYALPIDSVREVVTSPKLCRIPTAPAAVLGLFNLRGEVVPLLDTGLLVGLSGLTAWPFAAVIRTSLGTAGLGASSWPESVLLDEPMGPSESPGTLGLYAVGRRLAALIDIDGLLTPARIGGHLPAGAGRHEDE
jgi:purine-binding chemotaxis protein CheW